MKKRHQVLFVLSVLSMITFLDRISLSAASTQVMESLSINTIQWGWILGIFTISYALFEVPTGWMGDMFGGKKTLIRVVIWWSVFTILTGFANGFWMLLVIRFLFGMGEAGAYPNTSIILAKWFPAFERARAQAMIWGASRVGAALTPFIVLPIQQQYGWELSFYILGAVGIIWCLYFYWRVKEDPTEDANVGKDELNVIITHREMSVKIEKDRINFWSGFKYRNFSYLLIMYITYAIGAYFFQSWFHTYLAKGRGMTKDSLLWASSLPYLLGMVGCLSGGWLSDGACKRWGKKWGRRIVPMIGLFVAGICIICAASIKDNMTAIIFLGIGMAFMDLTAPAAWAVAMDVGGERSGTVSGAMNSAGLLGAYLMTTLFGYLANAYGYNFPLLVIGMIVLLGTFIWLKINAEEKVVFEIKK
jgi:MFS family permease